MPNNSAQFSLGLLCTPMPSYFSATPVFFTPTDKIRAWDEKSIVVTRPSGGKTEATLRVEDADPNSRDGGKCSVAAFHVVLSRDDEGEWVEAGFGKATPPTKARMSKRFLMADALNLIESNEEYPAHDLLLRLPTEEDDDP